MTHGPKPARAALTPSSMALDIMYLLSIRDVYRASEVAEKAPAIFDMNLTTAADRVMLASPVLFQSGFENSTRLQDRFRSLADTGDRIRDEAEIRPYLNRVLWLAEHLISSGNSGSACWLLGINSLRLWSYMPLAMREILSINRQDAAFEMYYRQFFKA